MAKFIWYKDRVPNNLPVKQVYGIAFTKNGSILLRVENGKYKLTGGKPEEYDNNFAETLKREYLEELNVEIEDSYYLGYLLVQEKDEVFAQVRMITKIKSIGEDRTDIDTGKLYTKIICSQGEVKNRLNYPDVAGNKMLTDAINFANDKYKFL